MERNWSQQRNGTLPLSTIDDQESSSPDLLRVNLPPVTDAKRGKYQHAEAEPYLSSASKPSATVTDDFLLRQLGSVPGLPCGNDSSLAAQSSPLQSLIDTLTQLHGSPESSQLPYSLQKAGGISPSTHLNSFTSEASEGATRQPSNEACPRATAWEMQPGHSSVDVSDLRRILEITLEAGKTAHGKEDASRLYALLQKQRITDALSFCQLTPTQCQLLNIPFGLVMAVRDTVSRHYRASIPPESLPAGNDPVSTKVSSSPLQCCPPQGTDIPSRELPCSSVQEEGHTKRLLEAAGYLFSDQHQPEGAPAAPSDLSHKERNLTSLLSAWVASNQKNVEHPHRGVSSARPVEPCAQPVSSMCSILASANSANPQEVSRAPPHPVPGVRSCFSPYVNAPWCPPDPSKLPAGRRVDRQSADVRNAQDMRNRRGRRFNNSKFQQEEACCFGCGRPLRGCNCREHTDRNGNSTIHP